MGNTSNTVMITLQKSTDPTVYVRFKMFFPSERGAIVSGITRSANFNAMLQPAGIVGGEVPFPFKQGQFTTDSLLNAYGLSLQTTYSITLNRFVDGVSTPLV